jgi:CMP-N,N'-diacetyllegionaminic acid synthase
MITALIAVREGSVRVKNKNIRPFAESNLLTIKINQLKRIKEIKEICVSTDSSEMMSIANKLGAKTMLRPKKYANNSCSINDAWEYMAKEMNAENILYTNVTNPLVKDETYKKCIQKYFSKEFQHKSLNTVSLVKEFLWMNGAPLNYKADNQPRSQELPDVFHPNFAINIIKKDEMIKCRSVLSNNFFPFYIGKIESIDIDDEEDFKIAEIIYKEINLK